MGCLEAVRQGGHDEKEILPFLLLILALLIPLVFNARPSIVAYINLAIIYAVSAVGLNLLLGVAGQISLGHAAFMGIGGYTSAILMIRYGIPSIVSVLAGGLLAGLFGLIIGFPALRLKGFYLAIATMALGTAVTDVIKRMEILGADRGLTNVPPVTILATNSAVNLQSISLSGYLVTNHLFGEQPAQSKTGMAFRAMRDSEVAAKVLHKHFLLQGPSFCHLFFLGRRRWCHVWSFSFIFAPRHVRIWLVH